MSHSEFDECEKSSIDRRQLIQMLGAGGVIAVSGCLGNGGNESDSNTVQFLTMGVGDNIKQFFKENNAALEKETGKTIEFTSVTWDNAQQTVNNRVDGGEAPDVARWPARWIPQLVGKDALEPLDDLMKEDFLDKFYSGMADGCKYQGSYYGVPWASSNKCLFYNKNVFKKAGLDPENPTLDSWGDMLSAAKTIKQSADTPALGLSGKDVISTASQYYHYHWSHGADLINDKGTPVVNSAEGAKALTFYSDLHLKHGVTQSSPLSSDRQDIRQLFESGSLGMVIGHVYTGLNIKKAKENGEVDFDYGIVQVPKGPGGRFSLNTIDTMAVFSQTNVKDTAYDLLKFYYDEERRFNYSSKKGFMPVMKTVGQRDYFQNSSNWKPFIEAGQYARARPKLANFNEFNNRMIQAIQEALADQKSPQKALDDAQSDLKGMMG